MDSLSKQQDDLENLSTLENKDLCVSQLESLPLKKSLEILFTVNIIPSRRQLALKYGLDEQLIHIVLSHRAYILQNWKYNSDTKRLLTKQELENAMAITEMLLEWKRRVQLNGLQMTQTALLRKAMALQKILNAYTLELNTEWWNLFNDNWNNKHFYDCDNDSLELEDILNDLQWMFSQHTFTRLVLRIQRAKNENRIRGGKRAKEKASEQNDFVDFEDDPLDVSEIIADPHYYNDDDFKCEDYEFVLDENIIMESLREELAGDEAAKYQKHMIGDDDIKLSDSLKNESIEKAEMINSPEIADTEDFLVENYDIEFKSDIDFESSQEKSLSPVRSVTPIPIADFLEPVDSTAPAVHAPLINKIVALNTTSINSVIPTPKPFRRKTRNMHAVLTVRKDYVRLPGSAEIANLAKNKFIVSDQNVENNDSDDDNTSEENLHKVKKQITTRKQASPPSKGKINPKTQSKGNIEYINSCSSSTNKQSDFELKAHVPNDSNFEEMNETKELATLMTSVQSNSTDDLLDEIKEEEIITSQISGPEESTTPERSVSETKPISELLEIQHNKNLNNQNIRRSKRFALKKKLNDLESDSEDERKPKNETITENEFIFGGPTSYKAREKNSILNNDEKMLPEVIKPSIERRKQTFQDQFKLSSVELFSSTTISQSNDIEMPAVKANVIKRMKRRTDGSDLTLRRDKVRINQAPVTDPNITSLQDSNPEHFEMVVEPYANSDD